MYTVHRISEAMQKVPYAMILLVDNPDIDLTEMEKGRWRMSPSLVREDIHLKEVKGFYGWCTLKNILTYL